MSGTTDRLPHERAGDGLPPVPTLTKPLSVLAFWSAIALPALYLPLLAAGLETVDDLAVFLGLFALHVVALVVGRSYRPGR